MTKGRSPNYPSLTLAEALERLRPVYDAVHTYATPKEVFVEHMGYSSLSGRALTLWATFKRYGLVESVGAGELQISGVALSIMELPQGSAERSRALQQAALAPSLFSDLHAEYPDDLPSDGLLRHGLIKRGFLPKAADEIIRVYKANLELVEEKRGEYNPPMPTLDTAAASAVNVQPKQRFFGGSNVVETNERFLPQWEYRFKVSRDTDAKVVFIGGEATQEAVEKLSELLKVQKDTFPTEAELRQRDQEGGFAE